MIRRPPRPTPFPYPTLFRSLTVHPEGPEPGGASPRVRPQLVRGGPLRLLGQHPPERPPPARAHGLARRAHPPLAPVPGSAPPHAGPPPGVADRSEKRRGGEKGRSRGGPD